jgi:hypothetical protein
MGGRGPIEVDVALREGVQVNVEAAAVQEHAQLRQPSRRAKSTAKLPLLP